MKTNIVSKSIDGIGANGGSHLEGSNHIFNDEGGKELIDNHRARLRLRDKFCPKKVIGGTEFGAPFRAIYDLYDETPYIWLRRLLSKLHQLIRFFSSKYFPLHPYMHHASESLQQTCFRE